MLRQIAIAVMLCSVFSPALAGPATHFSVVAPSPVGSFNNNSLTVTALDALNATDTTYAGTVHFTSSDPGYVNSSGDGPLTNGTGSFNFALKTAGPQTITATDSVNLSITGTSNTIMVNPGPTSRFLLNGPSNPNPGVVFNFTVTAADLYGNTTPAYSGVVHFTSTDAGAVLPADSTLSNGAGTFSATLQAANMNESITATDTVDSSITGSVNFSTLPVRLQGFDVE